jgi:hypothetical protein
MARFGVRSGSLRGSVAQGLSLNNAPLDQLGVVPARALPVAFDHRDQREVLLAGVPAARNEEAAEAAERVARARQAAS